MAAVQPRFEHDGVRRDGGWLGLSRKYAIVRGIYALGGRADPLFFHKDQMPPYEGERTWDHYLYPGSVNMVFLSDLYPSDEDPGVLNKLCLIMMRQGYAEIATRRYAFAQRGRGADADKSLYMGFLTLTKKGRQWYRVLPKWHWIAYLVAEEFAAWRVDFADPLVYNLWRLLAGG